MLKFIKIGAKVKLKLERHEFGLSCLLNLKENSSTLIKISFSFTWWIFQIRNNRAEVFWKKVFLKRLQNSQENTCARVHFLIKLQARAFLKRSLAQKFFCVFCEIFKNTFFIEHLLWLCQEWFYPRSGSSQEAEYTLYNYITYSKYVKISRHSQLNHRLSQYASKHFKTCCCFSIRLLPMQPKLWRSQKTCSRWFLLQKIVLPELTSDSCFCQILSEYCTWKM